MPVALYSADGQPREYIFQGDPESRARLTRGATAGDTVTVCECRMPHFALGESLKCGALVLSVHFRAHGYEMREGPAFNARGAGRSL